MKIPTYTLKFFCITLMMTFIWLPSISQIRTPAPSPLGTFTQMVGLAEISMEYSRPGVKGRMVFGDTDDHLLKYGQIWRAGANSSTKISFSEDVKVNGTAVPKGQYAIFITPGASEWKVILYNDLSRIINNDTYKAEDEQTSFMVKPNKLQNKVETLTFEIGNITTNTATLDMRWENTQLSLNIETDVEGQVMEMIANTMKNPYGQVAGNFAQAAGYYYNNDKDLNQALEWINKAIEFNPSMFNYESKANIQAKLKDYKGALKSIEAAHKAGESSTGGTKDFYESTFKGQLDKKAAEWKKM